MPFELKQHMIRYYHLERFGIAREGMAALTKEHTEFECAGSGPSISLMLHQLPWLDVQILIIDMDIERDSASPLGTCLELCQTIRANHPGILIILHSPYNHAVWINRFIEAGVKGYVSKNSGHAELLRAMRTVLQGKFFLCPIFATLFSNLAAFEKDNSIPLKPVNTGFTAREAEVLALLIQGQSTKNISDRLNLSVKTIETHRKNLVLKAQVKNTAELVRFASLQGLVIA